MRLSPPVVGIDVGGPSKGYHAVALCGREVKKVQSADPKEIADWCDRMNARAIGVDAPCCWSTTGRARPAERALMKKGIWCFSTPKRETALEHPKRNFAWMISGEALYQSLTARRPLYKGNRSERAAVFETFPHAIVCALSGACIPAKNKSRVRRKLLERLGVDTTSLTNIDWIDAGLCALTAREFVNNEFVEHGDVETGFIVVPENR